MAFAAAQLGPGVAKFVDPPGELRGRARACFNERGEASLVLQATKLVTASPCESLLEFLMGTRHEHEGRASITFGGRTNPCTELSVRTPAGTYRASGRLIYSLKAKLLPTSGRLTFSPARSEFEATTSGPSRYWVLPLSNFLSHFRDSPGDDLRQHPLRLYRGPVPRTTTCSSILSQEQWAATENERVIAFSFAGAPAFIERLPDYPRRKKGLINGRARASVTAVMVGNVGEAHVDFESINEWPPYRFLDFLGMATGTPVGTPWIELRDENGRLVRRRHVSWGVPAFGKGHAAIREEDHHGIGRLLEAASRFRGKEAEAVGVAVRGLVKGGLFSMTIEDKLDHLFRALDGLCEVYKTKETDAVAALGVERHATIQGILRQAGAEISDLAKTARAAGNDDLVSVLNRIVNTVSNAANVQIGFGKAVLKLLERFSLPDGEILARDHAVYPRADRKDWPAQLSWYRALTMHKNYFDIRGGFELDAAVVAMFHLQDILTRIILNAVGYDGYYQPPVVKMAVRDLTPNWVTASTPAGALGYGKPA
jgi:hypothetical protein